MKAIALYSGGLDSTLVIALLQRLGVEVIPLTFEIPFGCGSGDAASRARVVRKNFGLELKSVPLREEYLDILRRPRFGRGKNLNPCIDCKILMLRKSAEMLAPLEASFVATGEVLGQRPMSQHRQALQIIEQQSGLEGLVLRPLSAKLLPPTLPEQNGWIDRERLLDLSGRSRRAQLELAKTWELEGYGSPAGGCLLTDPGYCARLRDLMESGLLNMENTQWIRFGRYFNLSAGAKLVVARQEQECRKLEELAGPGDWLLFPLETSGPTALLRGPQAAEWTGLAAALVAYYCRKASRPEIVLLRAPDLEKTVLQPEPVSEKQALSLRI